MKRGITAIAIVLAAVFVFSVIYSFSGNNSTVSLAPGSGESCFWPPHPNAINPSTTNHDNVLSLSYSEVRLLCYNGVWRASQNDWPYWTYVVRNETPDLDQYCIKEDGNPQTWWPSDSPPCTADIENWGIRVSKPTETSFGNWKLINNDSWGGLVWTKQATGTLPRDNSDSDVGDRDRDGDINTRDGSSDSIKGAYLVHGATGEIALLDSVGAIYPFGALFGGGTSAIDIAISDDGLGGYVLNAQGQPVKFGTAPAVNLSALQWYSDVRKIELSYDSVGNINGVYMINKNTGEVVRLNSTGISYPFNNPTAPVYFQSGTDNVLDFVVSKDGTGGYIFDKNKFLHSLGNAPVLNPVNLGWYFAAIPKIDIAYKADGTIAGVYMVHNGTSEIALLNSTYVSSPFVFTNLNVPARAFDVSNDGLGGYVLNSVGESIRFGTAPALNHSALPWYSSAYMVKVAYGEPATSGYTFGSCYDIQSGVDFNCDGVVNDADAKALADKTGLTLEDMDEINSISCTALKNYVKFVVENDNKIVDQGDIFYAAPKLNSCKAEVSILEGGVCAHPDPAKTNIGLRAGTRIKNASNDLQYCDPLSLTYKDVLANGVACENDFQCLSNVCLSGTCTSVQDELAAQANLLQKIWCAVLHPVHALNRDGTGQTDGNNNYLKCLNEFQS